MLGLRISVLMPLIIVLHQALLFFVANGSPVPGAQKTLNAVEAGQKKYVSDKDRRIGSAGSYAKSAATLAGISAAATPAGVAAGVTGGARAVKQSVQHASRGEFHQAGMSAAQAVVRPVKGAFKGAYNTVGAGARAVHAAGKAGSQLVKAVGDASRRKGETPAARESRHKSNLAGLVDASIDSKSWKQHYAMKASETRSSLMGSKSGSGKSSPSASTSASGSGAHSPH